MPTDPKPPTAEKRADRIAGCAEGRNDVGQTTWAVAVEEIRAAEQAARERFLERTNCGHWVGLKSDAVGCEVCDAIATARAEGRREERERCCKAMCIHCNGGDQPRRLSGYWLHQNLRHDGSDVPCDAAAIRALDGEET